MSERITATVTQVAPETPSLTAVHLDLAHPAYTTPGQYLVVHPPEDKPVFLAIASGPGAPIELLLGATAQDKLQLVAGATISVDPPAGKGFPIELARGRDLLLFGVGSGASALRAVVEHIRRERAAYGRVIWFHGARVAEEHAYRGLDEAWSADGVELRRTVSKPWVQDLFRADPPAVSDAVAFLCGTKDMVAGVKAALAEAGMPEDRVRMNF